MKHKLLSLSIGTAVLLSVTGSYAGGHEKAAKSTHPKIYGRLDVGLARQDDDGSDAVWDVQSHSSRLGVKGKVETNSDVTVVYKYEVELNPTEEEINDSSDSNFLKARNQYVGLKTGFGTFKLGRMDTPLKKSQGKVDIFGDHAGDMKSVLEGENRAGDMIHYKSPEVNGFQVKAALIAGENGDSASDFNADDNGIADGTSISVVYKADNFYAAVAQDMDVDRHDLTRLTGTAKLGDFGVGVLYQTGESVPATAGGTVTDHDGYVLSGYYKVGATKLKLQYTAAEDDTAGATTDLSLLALGAEYKLAKSTTLYGEYATLNTETATTDTDDKEFVVGIKHNF